MLTSRPLVSAVIPTHRRSDLVIHAVRSALGQSLEALEVIVVVDGDDDGTAYALRQFGDPRLRVVISRARLGNAEARNAGVTEARATWVAFLDDDDLWLPLKLERQLQTALRSSLSRPIVSCRLIARSEASDFVWPRRLPAPGEALSEYLFCRSSVFSGEGILPTSTIFTSRALLQDVPFRRGLLKHVDPDWLFRAIACEGAGVEFVTDREPLAIWNIDERRSRISNNVGWRYSIDWIRENRELVTSRAYASFLLTVASSTAARAGDWRAFPLLVTEAYRGGKPSMIDLGIHLANFLVPDAVRRWSAGASARRHARVARQES